MRIVYCVYERTTEGRLVRYEAWDGYEGKEVKCGGDYDSIDEAGYAIDKEGAYGEGLVIVAEVRR